MENCTVFRNPTWALPPGPVNEKLGGQGLQETNQ
jgi:hypothetical protein